MIYKLKHGNYKEYWKIPSINKQDMKQTSQHELPCVHIKIHWMMMSAFVTRNGNYLPCCWSTLKPMPCFCILYWFNWLSIALISIWICCLRSIRKSHTKHQEKLLQFPIEEWANCRVTWASSTNFICYPEKY